MLCLSGISVLSVRFIGTVCQVYLYCLSGGKKNYLLRENSEILIFAISSVLEGKKQNKKKKKKRKEKHAWAVPRI